MENSEKWSLSRTETFWKDIAPCEHVLQIYENTEVFINTLAAFVGTGINAGESVIIIAAPGHRKLLEEKLKEHVMQLETLVSSDRYIVLDAKETLEQFMVNGLPDRQKFLTLVTKVIERAKGKDNLKVRAFGEMVALLWDQGDHEATIQLEELWNVVCKKENLSLFCAYPRNIFDEPIHDHIDGICHTHSKIIKDSNKPLTEVMYQELPHSA